MFNTRYIAEKPDYIETRGNKNLLIWKNIPHWMITDNELPILLNMLNGRDKLGVVIEKFSNKIDREKNEVTNDLLQILPSLMRSKITYKTPKKRSNNKYNNKPILENITINVTNKCNLNCKHCFNRLLELPPDTLVVSDVRNFIECGEKYISKNLTLALLGGEPLLNKEKVLSIAKIGYDFGFESIVSTNGIKIDDDFAKNAVDLDLIVQVSLEGNIPKINNNIRGNGTFEKALKGINICMCLALYNCP